MAHPNGGHREPELAAAIVNTGVVLLMALGLCAAAFAGMALDDKAVVSAASLLRRVFANAVQVAVVVMAAVPFAVFAGWRTWVHARRYCTQRGTGWLGVAEAAGLGLAAALLVLFVPVLRSPSTALPYVLGYGGGATVLGLIVGLVLRFSALLTLRRFVVFTYTAGGSSESGIH